ATSEELRQFAPEYERGNRAFRPRIIARALSDLAKSRPVVETKRRSVVFSDFEKNLCNSARRDPREMMAKKIARKPAPARLRIHRDAQDFGFIGGTARHQESGSFAASAIFPRDMGDNRGIGQQPFELG